VHSSLGRRDYASAIVVMLPAVKGILLSGYQGGLISFILG
jgi:hypothetical protein